MNQCSDFIGFQLVQICRAHRNRADAALNELGLHVGQEWILFELWREEGPTHSQLAEQMCLEPPTITKMLQRMEGSGLVERRQDSEDARVSRVYLTDNGRGLEKQVIKVWQQLEVDTVRGLNETEQLLLRRLLIQISHNLTNS
jgi:MarR family transcriptional regulator, organic hydroperoxide resistance regulator